MAIWGADVDQLRQLGNKLTHVLRVRHRGDDQAEDQRPDRSDSEEQPQSTSPDMQS